ncbi:fam-a protein [Plasmodium yoelii]|uniref:Fam-a protein n=1 Tax=Plasmodium yoelii TaxID=5861 RepID=A0A4V0KFS5_PLAYE|nr:fam-a protein [Plasmodium yoelii]VTZ71954.1 fam-a protein [Plasmodium yoelii]|eukprot:XP_726989.2 fam-a protein [Plasmodium yoelii]
MNKFYIQIVFFLLIISLFVNNKTHETELDPEKYIIPKFKNDTKLKSKKDTNLKSKKDTNLKSKKDAKPKSKKDAKLKSPKRYLTSEEIYEKNKHLLHNDPKETLQAYAYMNKALNQLEYHATSKDGYKLYDFYCYYNIKFYKKKHQGHTLVKKVEYTVVNLNKYNELINMFWDPDSSDFLYEGSVKRKIVRVYNPNLVMIQQRSKSHRLGRQKYFYALAAKFKISENKTMIVMASANINDHNHKNVKSFRNTIVENANLFKANIDSEDDIRNGKLQKMFVNLNGYIVEKKRNRVYITYINSNDEHASI